MISPVNHNSVSTQRARTQMSSYNKYPIKTPKSATRHENYSQLLVGLRSELKKQIKLRIATDGPEIQPVSQKLK